MTGTVAILGTRYPDFAIESAVLGTDTTLIGGDGASASDIVELAAGASVVIAGSRPWFSADVIAALDDCRGIVRSGIGVDSVDLAAAQEAGMWVVNVPDYGTEAVAQHALGLALAASRRVVEAHQIVVSGSWGFDSLRPLHLPSSMTAGVVGYGRIGRRVAQLLEAVGFGRILVHEPLQSEMEPAHEATSLGDLLSRADVVTLHAAASDHEPLLGPSEIGRMRAGSVLVNTSRGSLVDPDALAAGLARGAPRVAALDVFRPEPPDLTPLAAHRDRLILSPHIAWYSEETQTELRRRSAEEARRILNGERPLHPVVSPERTPS